MRKAWVVSAFLLLFIDRAAVHAAAADSRETPEKSLGEAYSVLSGDRLLNPQPTDKTVLLEALFKLKSLAHPVSTKPSGPKVDGALPFVTLNPPQVLGRLDTHFQKGNFVQSAAGIRRIMQICTECHAKSTKPNWPMIGPNTGLTLIEYADFFKLVGRSNDALLYYEKILTKKGAASERPDIWERAATNVVALGIETAGSAYTFVDVLSNLLQETSISKKQRDMVTSWRTQGKAWGLERTLPSKPSELLEHARMLTSMGDNNNKALITSGLVAYARALMELKKVGIYGSTDQKTKAFLMMGEVREKLTVPGVWLQPEDYYEACIRSAPHSQEAARCWNLLTTLSARDPKFVLAGDTNQQLQALLH
ncbi:MAG: hypothetical protein H7249_13895 [Chitinophagaceae bacterium]|nr:hypothetical protein [Oligoflexus sp.]